MVEREQAWDPSGILVLLWWLQHESGARRLAEIGSVEQRGVCAYHLRIPRDGKVEGIQV